MSDEQLTPNEFLRLTKGDIDDIFENIVPESKGQPTFEPNRYVEPGKTFLTHAKKMKADNAAKAAERRSILNWAVPILLIGPGLISIIAAGWSQLTAILFSGGAVVIIGFLWFFGRIWAWETKNFEKNVDHAERTLNRIVQERAKQWAETRYDINPELVEWTEFSNFYISGKGYCWREQDQEGHFLLYEADTENEVPTL